MENASNNNRAAPRKYSEGRKILYTVGLVVLLLFLGYLYYSYFFVFGQGVKSGELNYVVQKGYLFKTYEGKLIQSGLKSRGSGSIQSNEFEFSISDPALAKKMMENSGDFYELHYKEYKNSLPWRGYSVYVVDSIVAVRPVLQN